MRGLKVAGRLLHPSRSATSERPLVLLPHRRLDAFGSLGRISAEGPNHNIENNPMQSRMGPARGTQTASVGDMSCLLATGRSSSLMPTDPRQPPSHTRIAFGDGAVTAMRHRLAGIASPHPNRNHGAKAGWVPIAPQLSSRVARTISFSMRSGE